MSENWLSVCSAEEIQPDLGVRALVNNQQVAIFKVQDSLYAIDAIDPFSNAAVIARGIVGDLDGKVVVASPLYKQHFELSTGQCLEDDSVKLKTYAIRENAGMIEVSESV